MRILSQDIIILYVDDDPPNLQLFEMAFKRELTVKTTTSAGEALRLLERGHVGVLLSDERMAEMRGIELLNRAKQVAPSTVRVMVTAFGDENLLYEAINQAQVHAFVRKPWKREDLLNLLTQKLLPQAQELHRKAAQVTCAEYAEAKSTEAVQSIVGTSHMMQELFNQADRFALSNAPILILGETGTGKELLARRIHNMSPRRGRQFVCIDCGSLSSSLIQAELFGHVKGAFTGALQNKIGLFEAADGGTVFLDEIGELPLDLQPALLRVLVEREVRRLGAIDYKEVDVRFIAATCQPLQTMVDGKRFREDLFQRLNVLVLNIPPLRKRPEDLQDLVKHFIAKHSRQELLVPERVISYLQGLAWPGNVRELENKILRALVLAWDIDKKCYSELTLDDFETAQPDDIKLNSEDVRIAARQAEAERMRQLLMKHAGNISRAAREFGVPRGTFVSRAQRYHLLG